MNIFRSCILAVIAAASASALAEVAGTATPSTAQTQGAAGVEEVIVTAQKRAENVQSVPIAVTAISGDDLAAKGVSDAQALARLVPNATFSDTNGEARINLRGLGFDNLWATAAEPRVAYHVDGAYLAQTADIFGTFYDIDRVEVNRGPQGTLYGRNAIAGTVNVITRSPTPSLSGYLNTEIGSYSTHNVSGAISGPLADGVSGRIAFQTRNHSGYDWNVPANVDINNQEIQSFRGKLKFDRSANFTATLSADYTKEHDRVGGILLGLNNPDTTPLLPGEVLGGIAHDGNPRHDYSNFLPHTSRTSFGFGLDAKLDLGSDFSLTSLTSYRRSDYQYNTDIDLTTLNLINAYNHIDAQQYSEELRLQKDFSRGNFVVGTYFFGEDYKSDTLDPLDLVIFGAPYGGGLLQGLAMGGRVRDRAAAGFGQLTYNLTDTTTLIAGARSSWERKRKIDEYFVLDLASPYDPNNPLQNTGPTLNGSMSA